MLGSLALAALAYVTTSAARADDRCPIPDIEPNVRIGHVDTGIPNARAAGDRCTLNDLIVEEAEHADRDAWLAHVDAALAAIPPDRLDAADRATVRRAAAGHDPRRFARVRVIAFNDFHGALSPPAPMTFRLGNATETVAVGGADALAATARALGRGNPRASILVSAGDLIGASPLVSSLFLDEPTVEVMNRIGLAVNGLGNHEFDGGIDALRRLARGGCHAFNARTCQGAAVGTPVPYEGARFDLVAANVIDTARGAPAFPSFVIHRVNGVRVGFVGAVLEGTPSVVIPSGVAGLRFGPEADAINREVRAARAAGAELVVVLLHEGGRPASFPVRRADLDACDDVQGPIRAIVARLDDAIDAVASAHSHRIYNCRMPNRAGRAIPVTQAGSLGRVLTTLDFTVDRASGTAVGALARNVLVARDDPAVPPDAAIARLVAGYERLAAPVAETVAGRVTRDFGAVPDRTGQSATGLAIADAQLDATRGTPQRAVVAFMNPGGVRGALRGRPADATRAAGTVTYADAFAVQPFGNVLVTMTLTGRQIERLLEEQFPGCANGQTFARVLHPSQSFRYAWREDGPPCDRVDPASITIDGVPVNPDARYRVTVNDFLAEGGDRFDVLKEGTERVGGGRDVDALVVWLGARDAREPPPLDRIERRR